ncbi:PaaR repeat-containing protein [Lysinibacillus fusiformis]|nr:PaaR repeat-containing protein [Lysinibacillus fusiformis]
MPAAIRKGDICKGHGCFVPRANDEGSHNVFINGIPAHRVGDHWMTHCCGAICHDSVAATGSPNVFVNKKQLCRVDDLTACGSSMGNTHSPNVFVNDRG